MARHVCWDARLVRRYFTTEASTKASREDFLRLHLPMERIRVLDAKPMVFRPHDMWEEGGSAYTGEAGLLAALQASILADPNRIFVVVGEPGSGKSHLARWIEHSLDDASSHFPIHIPRHIDTLEAVVRRLEERTGIATGARPSSHLLTTPADKLVRYLLASIEMELGSDTPEGDRDPGLAQLVESAAFRALVQEQVGRYQAERKRTDTGLKTRELLELGAADFAALREQIGEKSTLAQAQGRFERLAAAFGLAVRRLANLDRLDLKQLLAAISERCIALGRRPVLILEDVTSFDMLHDDLLMFLLDESAGHFDALVCWTTGFEQNYMQTYQEQRYTARLSLTDDQNEAYSLQDGRCVDLVRRYLDAVRLDIPGGCPVCARAGPIFDNLYPFNTPFVQRLYDNLTTPGRERRRTPRHLLDRAVKAYLELAERDGAFPPLKQPDAVQDIYYDTALYRYREEYAAFVALVSWYGERQDGSLRLPHSLARHLGVAIPEEFEEDDLIEIHLAREAPEQAVVRAATLEVDLQNRFKSLRLELQSWYNHGTPLDHYLDLQRGAYKTLQFFRHRLPLTFAHPAGPVGLGQPLTYGRSTGEVNIFIRSTRMKPQRSLQLEIGPGAAGLDDEQNYLLLETLLALQVFGSYPEDADLALLGHWADAAHTAYRERIERRLTEGLGMDLPTFLLLAKFLLLNRYLAVGLPPDPLTLLTPLDVEIVADGEDPAPVDFSPLRALAEVIDGALVARFFIARDFLDYPRLAAAIARLDVPALVERAAAIVLTRVDEDFRFAGGIRLRDLARAVKGVCAALGALDPGELYRRIAAELAEVQAATVTAPTAIVERMERLGDRLGLYSLHELYDSPRWRQWQAAVSDLPDGEATDASELRKAIASLLQPPADPYGYFAWLGRIRQIQRRPTYRTLRAALDLLARLEPELNSAEDTGMGEMLRDVLGRRDALLRASKPLRRAR